MTGPARERCFTPGDVRPVAGVPGEHLVVLRAGGGPAGVLRRPARYAPAVARRPGIVAVTIAAAGADRTGTGLALAFAEHLRAVRARRGLGWACVTAATRPATGRPGLVRLPHLVAFAGATVTDLVIWEVLTGERARAWLGRPLPGVSFEDRLDTLLRLRAAARRGGLPRTAAGRRLADLLTTRYLSIRLVYEHPGLFLSLAGSFREDA